MTSHERAKKLLDETIGYAQYALTNPERLKLVNEIAKLFDLADTVLPKCPTCNSILIGSRVRTVCSECTTPIEFIHGQ